MKNVFTTTFATVDFTFVLVSMSYLMDLSVQFFSFTAGLLRDLKLHIHALVDEALHVIQLPMDVVHLNTPRDPKRLETNRCLQFFSDRANRLEDVQLGYKHKHAEERKCIFNSKAFEKALEFGHAWI